jgi:hypothetical protein
MNKQILMKHLLTAIASIFISCLALAQQPGTSKLQSTGVNNSPEAKEANTVVTVTGENGIENPQAGFNNYVVKSGNIFNKPDRLRKAISTVCDCDLDATTTAGNTTTNSITVGGLRVNGTSYMNLVRPLNSTDAMVIGESNTVTATSSLIAGFSNNISIASNSVAVFGKANTVTNTAASTVVGYNNSLTNSSNLMFIFGRGNMGQYTAYGTVLGYENSVYGTSTASIYNGSAVGVKNSSRGSHASAVGTMNTALSYNASAFGFANVAGGTSKEDASAFGSRNTATGTNSSAVGYFNNASAEGASSFGKDNSASNTFASAFGNDNISSGYAASAFGKGNSATGSNGLAFGNYNSSTNSSSAAFGRVNHASGNMGSAFGYGNSATATSSSAFGKDNYATGIMSSAFGKENTASGTRSVAFGFGNNASVADAGIFGISLTNNVTNSVKVGIGGTTPAYMMFLNNGYAGIGTTTPSAKLTVNAGNIHIIDASNPMILVGNAASGGNYGYLGFKGATKDVHLVAGTGGDLVLGIDFGGTITGTGNVGIGTATPSEKLAVNGNIRAKKLKITQTGWPDYVFEKEYKLIPLNDLEKFVLKNKHLPGVPSVSDVDKDGVDVGDTQAILLKKIEELTLYIIEQNKRLEALEAKVKTLPGK